MSDWTPELRKQLRRFSSNWKSTSGQDPEKLAASYAAWYWNEHRHGTIHVFPHSASGRRAQDRVRNALESAHPVHAYVEIDNPEDYV